MQDELIDFINEEQYKPEIYQEPIHTERSEGYLLDTGRAMITNED
jgi:hypothetical protein